MFFFILLLLHIYWHTSFSLSLSHTLSNTFLLSFNGRTGTQRETHYRIAAAAELEGASQKLKQSYAPP